MSPSLNWLVKKVDHFKKVGFFGSSDLSSVLLAEKIFKMSEKDDYFGVLRESDSYVDWQILSYDKNRVWLIIDSSQLAKEEEFKNNFYENVFKKLQFISLGKIKLEAFNRPAEISVACCRSG